MRDLGIGKFPRRHALQDPRRLAAGRITLEPAALRIGRFTINADGSQGGAIEHGGLPQILYIDWMLGRVGAQPPPTTIHVPTGLSFAAASICFKPSARDRADSQCNSEFQFKPATVACICESISPGITVRPPRLTTTVLGPIQRRISLSVPTATNRPFFIATASFTEKEESTVTTLPFTKTRSAGGRGSKNACGTSSPRPLHEARSKPKK